MNDSQNNFLSAVASEVSINQIEEKDEKLKYMKICDNAFTISVLKRDNFSELFEKIQQNAIFLGVKYNSEIAGYIAFYANDFDSKSAFITLICIADKFQRLHLGTELMNSCIKISKKMGMKQIKLEVLSCDTPAINFYKKCGFIRDSIVSEESFYMKKIL